MKEHHAYTDGASSGNPGPSGWCYELDGELEWGTAEFATNNEMEMVAALMALQACPNESKLIIHTDSKLMIGLLGRGWKSRANPNLTQIQTIFHDISVIKSIIVEFIWIKGHADDENHNKVDAVARQMAREQKTQANAMSL
jgi:ribonuclease HI